MRPRRPRGFGNGFLMQLGANSGDNPSSQPGRTLAGCWRICVSFEPISVHMFVCWIDPFLYSCPSAFLYMRDHRIDQFLYAWIDRLPYLCPSDRSVLISVCVGSISFCICAHQIMVSFYIQWASPRPPRLVGCCTGFVFCCTGAAFCRTEAACCIGDAFCCAGLYCVAQELYSAALWQCYSAQGLSAAYLLHLLHMVGGVVSVLGPTSKQQTD